MADATLRIFSHGRTGTVVRDGRSERLVGPASRRSHQTVAEHYLRFSALSAMSVR